MILLNKVNPRICFLWFCWGRWRVGTNKLLICCSSSSFDSFSKHSFVDFYVGLPRVLYTYMRWIPCRCSSVAGCLWVHSRVHFYAIAPFLWFRTAVVHMVFIIYVFCFHFFLGGREVGHHWQSYLRRLSKMSSSEERLNFLGFEVKPVSMCVRL